MQFVVWKIYKCLLHQMTREIMSYLDNNLHEKTTQKGAGAICNLLSCYNFALVLHEIALVFSQ